MFNLMLFTLTTILTSFHTLLMIYSTGYITKQKMEKGTRGANKNRQKGHNLSVALNIQPLKTSTPKIPSKLKIAQ